MLSCLGIETSLQPLIIYDTSAHIYSVLGVCLHVCEDEKKLIWIWGLEKFFNFKLELLSLWNVTQVDKFFKIFNHGLSFTLNGWKHARKGIYY